jgi:hypothetical protein
MPHQKQIGVGFLSLQVEIPVFWLGGRRSPQECLKENAKQ